MTVTTRSEEPPVDRIVVETTGIADPLPVGLTFLQTSLRMRTSLEAIVTVVDCSNFALDLFKSNAAMAQIVHADFVVLNKADLVAESQVASLERRIQLIKPRARIMPAIHGCIPRRAVMDSVEGSHLAGLRDMPGQSSAHLHVVCRPSGQIAPSNLQLA